MNQFLSNKIISGIVAVALLVGVGVLVSSGDTSTTTRNAALVVATPCTKPGQVTKVSKQSVVCAITNTGSLWYATMKAKGKAQPCTTPGEIRKKSDIVWVCGVIKKKKLWQATQPLPPAVVASTTVIELGATQPTPALDSTQVATPEAPVVADNTVLADTKIPDDKIVTQVIDDVTTPPASTTTTTIPKTTSTTTVPRYTPKSTTTTTTPTVAPTTTTTTTTTTTRPTVAPTTPAPSPTSPAIPKTCAPGGTCAVGDTGPGGGKVFYAAPTPQTWGTYLEAAPTDYQVSGVRTGVPWGCLETTIASSISPIGYTIGTGKANTAKILSKCLESGSAARVAADYRGGGKSDWFLPSIDELKLMYTKKVAIGSFASVDYWSSSEVGASAASFQGFYGYGDNANKVNEFMVRPVRAF